LGVDQENVAADGHQHRIDLLRRANVLLQFARRHLQAEDCCGNPGEPNSFHSLNSEVEHGMIAYRQARWPVNHR
jgi:hypothetical protein